MTALAYILIGAFLYAIFGRYLRVAASLVVLLLSIGVAYRVTALIIPEVAELNWRGFWSGAGVGTVAAITLGALWFYLLGWRGRADQTMIDKIERAKQDNVKERKLV